MEASWMSLGADGAPDRREYRSTSVGSTWQREEGLSRSNAIRRGSGGEGLIRRAIQVPQIGDFGPFK